MLWDVFLWVDFFYCSPRGNLQIWICSCFSLCDESRSHSLSCQTSCCMRIYFCERWEFYFHVGRCCFFGDSSTSDKLREKKHHREREMCLRHDSSLYKRTSHSHPSNNRLTLLMAGGRVLSDTSGDSLTVYKYLPRKKVVKWSERKKLSVTQEFLWWSWCCCCCWGDTSAMRGRRRRIICSKVSLFSYKYRKSTHSNVTNDDVKINNDIYHFQFLSLCRTRHEDVNFELEWLEIMNNRSTTFPLDFSIHSSHRWLMSEAVKVRNCTKKESSAHVNKFYLFCVDSFDWFPTTSWWCQISSSNPIKKVFYYLRPKWKNRGDDSIHHIFMSFKRSFVLLLYL